MRSEQEIREMIALYQVDYDREHKIAEEHPDQDTRENYARGAAESDNIMLGLRWVLGEDVL